MRIQKSEHIMTLVTVEVKTLTKSKLGLSTEAGEPTNTGGRVSQYGRPPLKRKSQMLLTEDEDDAVFVSAPSAAKPANQQTKCQKALMYLLFKVFHLNILF